MCFQQPLINNLRLTIFRTLYRANFLETLIVEIIDFNLIGFNLFEE